VAEEAVRLARVTTALFVVSSAFPVVAGLLNVPTPPRSLGIADVTVAAMLVVAAMVLVTRAPSPPADRELAAAFRAARAVAGIIPVLLVLFFLAGNRVNWQVLVIGLAWRGWLFVYIAPFLVAR
jgi:hypothetical protein